MLVAWLRSRVIARAAIGGLAFGGAALAVLALWNTANTAGLTAQVRRVNATSNQWTELLVHINDEDEDLNDYIRADTPDGRLPLAAAVGSAGPTLTWLAADSSGEAHGEVILVTHGYQTFTRILTELLQADAAGQTARVQVLADEAALVSSALRKQTIARLSLIHDNQNVYLADVGHRNRRLRLAEALVLVLDALLLALSALLLLAHQRRIEREAAQSNHQALHDGLTGIPNRLLLQDRLQLAMAESQRTRETSALLLLDLDRFKEVNDSLGHHHGDLLLCEVAKRLKAVLREGDTVARLGGDEFAILLRRMKSVGDVLVIAERALEALRRPAVLKGETVLVGASIGVAISPDHSREAEKLLRFADVAMYEAKRQSSGVVIYQPDSGSLTPSRAVAASELAAAIEAGQLVVHYQPKLHLRGGQIVGMEALVRWQHPERGLLGPDRFVPMAEQSDLILLLTDTVLDQALAAHRTWVEHGWSLAVSINVGVRSLLVHDLAERIEAALDRHGTDPGDLVLEITESAFITDIGRAVDVLGRLRELGVRISIDDFGTGYSSMTYLQALPADELKIDRGFVGSLKGSRSEAIVRATLQLGHSLGLWVTAEGVEDEKTLTLLGQIGCDLAQGFHICRPVPAAELIEWLETTQWEVGRPPFAVPPLSQPS